MNGTGPAADVLRFGTELAGVPVLLPAGAALEFVPSAAVHPLPLAPRRVLGLMQLRGQPLVVVDPAREPVPASAAQSLPVLVVGTPPEAAALRVAAAPRALKLGAAQPSAALPDCRFASALGAALSDASRSGGVWFEVDPARLFAELMQD